MNARPTFEPLTVERLKEVLGYDADTGEFRWKLRLGGKATAGRIAGSVDRGGYRAIRIDRRLYLAHRLAWLYVYGAWPDKWLDHINRITDDNRIENLRLAEPWQNHANKTAYRTNTSGFKGVWWCAGKWMAQIQVQNRVIYLGRFADVAEAGAAYEAAAVKYLGDFVPR